MQTNINNVNKEILFDMLHKLPENKMEVLKRALERNFVLTSSYILEHGSIRVYKEGFYVTLEGTRCSFSVFAYDRDGEIEISQRKPRESKLNFLYEESLHFSESDFREF